MNEYLYCCRYADLKADGLTLHDFFKHDRAVRESGHDTTHRFDDRTADFVSVDLNSLLYKYETDFAELLESEFGGNLLCLGRDFRRRGLLASARRPRKTSDDGVDVGRAARYFFDYDFVNHRRSTYISATGLWPLWARILRRTTRKK